MKYILRFILLLTFMGAKNASAQEAASISGYVTDSESGETLISASVGFLELNRGAATNSLGYYTITNIKPGTYTIVGTYVGYETFRQQITLEEGQNIRLDIELDPQSVQLGEIEVRSFREEQELKNISISQVETELIKELPAVFEADVFRSIQLLPGVKAASDFSSGLYIRGGSPDQTLILLDRTTVYNPSHFFGFFSTFNPDAIKDVRLYKGGYPSEYGGRLGSVLTIYNKDGNRNEMEGTVTASLLASRASIEGPYSKGSWMIAARRSTIEPLLAAIRQSEENVPSKFYFYDINSKINFDASDSDKFSLAIYAGQDRVTFPFSEDAEFELDYGNQTISGNWTHIFSEKLFSNFVLTGSRYFNYPEFEIAGTNFQRNNILYDFSLKSDLEYIPNQKNLVKTGFWAGNFTFKLRDRFDDSNNFTNRIQNQYASLYVQDEWRPAERWIITPGLRLNYFSDGDYLRLAPRLSVEHQPNSKVRLQAAYGRYNQFLTLISNEAFSGFDVWLTSAEGVSPAYGDQYIIGAKTIPFEGYGFDVELYYRNMIDLFELDPFLPDVAGLPYQDVFRFGEGYAYGMEVFFEKRQGDFSGFIGYTLGYTWRKFPGFNSPIGADSENARFYPPKYDRRHDINIVANYQITDRWKLTSSFNFATGQSYTKVLGRYAQFELPWTNDNRNVFTVGKVNASRLPNYHRLDLSLSRTGSFFGIAESILQLQVINVYSRRNVWFYNFDFSENPVLRTEANLLPILPSISYTVNF
ncbi:TonB-dependent receptor domain-containing protein [Gracilimonas sp.]|uniref:TonB-dependent receptor n=1 Tax=Gracilimonas sp. TaxID=1974203 RepID=UPI0028715E24|nr:TonB-dependent receptor [Gracilimonas sp.]